MTAAAEAPGGSETAGLLARSGAPRRKRRVGRGLAIGALVVFAVCAVVPSLIAPYNPTVADLNASLLGPGATASNGTFHLLGTDSLGHDVLSQLIYGTRPIGEVVLASLLLSGAFGLTYGLLAAFSPSFLGRVLMRIADIQLAIPSFVLAVLLAYLVGAGIGSSTLAIAVVTWPIYARLVRSEALKLRRADYVLAARVSGLTWFEVLRHHIFKNVASVFVIFLSFYVAVAIIIESSLSFLGYGVQPPTADWGSMLANGVNYFNQWWLAVVPGVAVILMILAVNTLGETLRQRLDPRAHAAIRSAGRAPGAAPQGSVRAAGSRPVPAAPAPAAASTAARIERLSVGTAAGRSILRDVSIRIDPGVVTAIVGESASGKSTICLALLDLLPESLRVTSGDVWVGGENITRRRASEMRRLRGRVMGAVFQDPLASLDPVRRVGKQLGEARIVHGLSKRKEAQAWSLHAAEDLLGFAEPASVLATHPHQLSGGMRQRICIGIAVSAEPDLLVADEPTTALDVSVRGRVLRSLETYRQQSGCAVVLVTHDIAIVRAMADRVVVLYGGCVLEQGPKDKIFAHPRSPYTKALMDASVAFDPTLRHEPLPTIAPGQADGAESAQVSGCPFAPRCPNALEVCWSAFPEAQVRGAGKDAVQVWCWNPVEETA
jgi:peptide/nickel transport system ATP-binding protein/peptide/nickel transport system permease protein